MENTDVLNVGAQTFLGLRTVDTSLPLRVYGIEAAFEPVVQKLLAVYGDIEVVADGEESSLSGLMAADVIEVAAQPYFDKRRYNVIDCERIIARLMQKPGGCPWDSVQTHDSIRINMIEEAYEAVDAIDKSDLENMKEEFGDVLLQSLLQSEIAKRDGEFDFDDVCDGLCKKLISRHTFIFGGDEAGSADDAITLWDKNKAKEKKYASLKEQLRALPSDFPALLRCQKVYKKSKKADAACDPVREYVTAVAACDYAAVIAASVALLAEQDKDAEVELNRIVAQKIENL